MIRIWISRGLKWNQAWIFLSPKTRSQTMQAFTQDQRKLVAFFFWVRPFCLAVHTRPKTARFEIMDGFFWVHVSFFSWFRICVLFTHAMVSPGPFVPTVQTTWLQYPSLPRGRVVNMPFYSKFSNLPKPQISVTLGPKSEWNDQMSHNLGNFVFY